MVTLLLIYFISYPFNGVLRTYTTYKLIVNLKLNTSV